MMLDAFYRQLFSPSEEDPPSLEVVVLIAGLILLVMTFNAASRLQVSASGLSGLFILFTLGGMLGVFWFTAAIYAISSCWGQSSDFPRLIRAVVAGLWPLIFSGAALSAQGISMGLGAPFSLLVTLGTILTLTRSLAAVQSCLLWQSLLCVFGALMFSVFSLFGVLVWPLMVFVGL